MNKAVFLDRDGTINHDSYNYVKNVAEFNVFNFVPEAIKIFNDMNFLTIVITNQSGISRGYFNENILQSMHRKMRKIIKKKNGKINSIYYCPHHPSEKCECRKPGTENVEIAIDQHNIDINHSYFIGDTKKDIITGHKIGCKTILVLTGKEGLNDEDVNKWDIKPDFIFDNLLFAAQEIKSMSNDNIK